MYWNPRLETLERAELEALQLKRLRATLRRVTRASSIYGKKLTESGVRAHRLRSREEVRDLPFTTSEDLRAAYPHGMLAVPFEKTLRLHTSSGTTGKPKAIFFSSRDVAGAAELMARCLVASGVGSHDILQNMMTYGLFTGALVMHYGAEKVGCLVIPAGPGNSEKQLLLMQDFRTTAIHITPSYALYFASYLEKQGVNPRHDLALKKAFIGAEPYTEETRRKIEDHLAVEVYNSYGLSEMNGPGVAFECIHKNGMHLWEDNFYMEIIDPQTGQTLPDGATGELVLTTLCREAMPLIRYRTRDITSINPEPCPCGRTHRRINRITGRTDDMLIVRGVNIYPQQIEAILMRSPVLGRNYVIELEGLDEMIVKVESSPSLPHPSIEQTARLQIEIADRLRSEILTRPHVLVVPPGTLPVSEGKAKRVVDRRSM